MEGNSNLAICLRRDRGATGCEKLQKGMGGFIVLRAIVIVSQIKCWLVLTSSICRRPCRLHFSRQKNPAMTDSLTFSSPSDEKREGEVREHSANNCFSSVRITGKMQNFPSAPQKNSFSSFLITHSPCSLSSLAFRGGEEFPPLYPHREFFAATYSMLLPDNESFEVGGILASALECVIT